MDLFLLVTIAVALALWLSERVRPFVPTLFLISACLLLNLESSPLLTTKVVFQKISDPTLGLFFCGMSFGVLLKKHGMEHWLANTTAKYSRHSLKLHFRIALFTTALLSMWTTNTTAMALSIPAFAGTLSLLRETHPKQASGYLLGLAMAANFGSLGTPMGAAPNAIALNTIQTLYPNIGFGFSDWIFLMLPLTFGLLLLTELLVSHFYEFSKSHVLSTSRPHHSAAPNPKIFMLLGTLVILWITTPWHGMSPLGLGFAAVTIIYAFGFLDTKDLKSVDWDVLLMIAGGLLLSYLMEKGNWPQFLSNALNSSGINGHAQLLILILVAAFGSAVSSNTATAVVLMPIAMKLLPQPSCAIAIAASCALGVCFSISTPANALLSGSHGLRNKDFLKLGLPIMLFGCLLIFFTAELVVNWWIKMA